MNLLTELAARDVIKELLYEIDLVMESYDNLLSYTQLNEGAVEGFDDATIERVVKLRSQVRTVLRARNWLNSLQGGKAEMSREELGSNLKRLTAHKSKLMKAIRRIKKNIDSLDTELRRQVMGEIKRRDAAQHAEEKNRGKNRGKEVEPEAGVDDDMVPDMSDAEPEMEVGDPLDPKSVPMLRRAAKGELDVTDIESNELRFGIYLDLLGANLIDDNGSITRKGSAALANHDKTSKAPAALSDLMKYDDDDEDDGGYDDGSYDGGLDFDDSRVA